jgi:hypothetical protein
MISKEEQKGRMRNEQIFKAEIRAAERKSIKEVVENIVKHIAFQKFLLMVIRRENEEEVNAPAAFALRTAERCRRARNIDE